MKTGTLRKWLHPLSFIIPLDWISATCLSDPLLHRDTQTHREATVCSGSILKLCTPDTETQRGWRAQIPGKKKSQFLQLFEAPSDLVVSADGAIAVFTMDCKLGQFSLFKGKKTCLLWGHFQKNPWLYPGKCVSLRQLHALLTNGLACPECPRTDF